MKDVIRVAAAVPEVKPGNVTFNLEQTKKYIARAREAGVRVLVMPELGLTGYSCGDLFFSQRLQEAVANAIAELEHETVGITVAVGAPIHTEGRLFNCALLYSDGKLVGVVPKMYLPNYGEFAEKRFFSPGLGAHTHTVRLLGRDIPFGKGLVFRDCNGLGLGIEICEDVWAPIPPSTMLALGGANIILNLSASTTMAAKHLYRRSLVTDMSARLMAMYVYTSSGYSESTADYVCCGYSAIASGGVLLAENEKYIDGDYMIYADSDLGCCRAERQRIDRFGDCVADSDACSQVRTVVLDNSFTCENAPCDRMKISPYPFIPSDEKERRERVAQVYELQCAALARRMKQTGCRPVIGVSGGLDSTLALMVAIGASERLGKGADYVLGLTMPCFGTSGATYKNSLALMESLKIESRTVVIGDSVKQHFRDIGHAENVYDAAYENAQARERTQVLMDVANMERGLVIGTGDLSELALGWCTYNGDHMSMYAVNASIPKTLIREMVRILADDGHFVAAKEYLLTVVGQPISPELLPPDAVSGNIAQKTEDIVGPYELHDFFLFYMVRFGYSPAKLFELATLAFRGRYDRETIKHWLVRFMHRFFTQQFKRSCAPDGVLTGSVFVSPRGGWNVPSDADGSLWITEAESIEV